MAARDLHREGFGLEAKPLAGGAGAVGLVAGQFLARPGIVRLAEAAFEVRDHALERLLHIIGAQAVLVAERDDLAARPVQHHLAEGLGQVLPGRGHRQLVVPDEAFQRLVVIGRGRARPGLHRAVLQAFRIIRHDQLRVEEGLGAEPVAGRAGALGAVEAEQPRLDLLDREAGDGAGEFLAEDGPFVAVGIVGIGDAVRQAERGLKAVRDARLRAIPHHDAVHHDLDVVLQLLVELRWIGQLMDSAIHLHALEAAPLPFLEILAVFPLLAPRDRGQQQQPRALCHRHDPVHHLGDGLRLDRQAGGRAVRHADPRPEQAHVVVDFRHRADGGTRIVAGGLLLDGDGGRQALDAVHIGLLHQLQELPRIGREGFDIAPLPLRIDGVEGQRGFPRPRQPRDHGQRVPRDVEVEVLQVVFPRAADSDQSGHLYTDAVSAALGPGDPCVRIVFWGF